jgi:capsular polysaccharide biosynthesis protein
MASFRPRNLTEFSQILWRRKSLIVLITVVVLTSAGEQFSVFREVTG